MFRQTAVAITLVFLLVLACVSAFGLAQPDHAGAVDTRAVGLSPSGYDISPLTDDQIEELAKDLTDEERAIILAKGTEPAFCGTLLDNRLDGHYLCRLCTLPLFSSDTKFDSGTGWPSFSRPFDDTHIHEVVDRSLGMVRTEILCTRCSAHLGHVFDDGPGPTGQRYCLNSASLVFVEKGLPMPDLPRTSGASIPVDTETAYFAGGCFWGIEHRLQQLDGVLDVASGYMGGHVDNPTYEQVCAGTTGHAEAVRVVFDPARVSYGTLLKSFFKLHDPTTLNRQGPDIGTQYRSAIYPANPAQFDQTRAFIAEQAETRRFKDKRIVTEVRPASEAGEFWIAEAYHQDYNERTGHACWLPVLDDEDE